MSVTEVFLNLDAALEGIPRTGIIHVGAHKGQEVPYYDFDKIVLVEPNPAYWERLELLGEVKRCAAGIPGRRTLYLTKYGTEASLLKPPMVISTIDVEVRPLNELQYGCNVAVIDTQGTELEVLQTADLSLLDAIIVECSIKQRYENEPLEDEIDEFLVANGWSVSSRWPHRRDFLSDVVYRKEV